MLFFKKNSDQPNDIDLTDVQRRVHGMREITERSASLQLFAKLGQEGRSLRDAEVTAAREDGDPLIPRLFPEQIPTTGER